MTPAWATQASHDGKVAAIAATMRDRALRGEVVDDMAKGDVKHVVPLHGSARPRRAPLDLGGLDRVLDIDLEHRLCVAESAVRFSQVVEATLEHGLLPKVVPELKGITLGGAVVGCSVESMSFRYGGFHDTCVEYELVTGTGEVLHCSRDQDADIFDMIHGSYGTLALLTRLTFELVPARPYVHLTYHTFTTPVSFHECLRREVAAGRADFIDGIIHAPDRFVLCLGELVEDAPYLSDYSRTKVFYTSTATRDEDYLRCEDYLFRYDTDCHWMTRKVPPLQWPPVRLVAGKRLLGSSNLIRMSRWHSIVSRDLRPDVVCDVFVPSRRFEDFFDWYSEEFQYYPLWVVPYRPPGDYPWIADEFMERSRDDLYIDCAVYGRSNNEPGKDYAKLLEREVYEVGGLKTLIGRNSYSPEQFWSIYNRANWERAKATLDPGGVLPGLYEHVGRVGDDTAEAS
ncbi:MAG TPA: FAD-binding oxidoreductase [Propionibacteriaceae bacterium]|nr:FAD-binding oxidoreductase [Propionibacteriaceae bacterium]